MKCNKKSASAELERLFETSMQDLTVKNKPRGVLVGFSGGADSVALLTLMNNAGRSQGFYVAAAHVNHLIRGGEAERDEAFCRHYCKELGIELFVLREDVPALARSCGMGIEECARDVRYKYFKKLVSDSSVLSHIATAHNADDNAESVILNMMRGTGLRGMCGIPPVRDDLIIRPILYASKSLILEYIEEQGLPFVTDSTNSSLDYNRNYVRKSIIPRLSRLSSAPLDAVAKMTKNLRLDDDFISLEANKAYSALCCSGRLSRDGLKQLHPSILSRVMVRAYCEKKHTSGAMLEATHIEAIASLIKGDNCRFTLDLPGGVRVICEYDDLWFATEVPLERARPNTPLRMGMNVLWGGECLIYLSEGRDREFENTYSNVYKFFIQADISSAIINGNLYARTRCDGDTYTSGGITKKVKKMLSERHYSIAWRDSLPLVCDDSGIVWIPGFAARGIKEKRTNKMYAYFCKVEEKDE